MPPPCIAGVAGAVVTPLPPYPTHTTHTRSEPLPPATKPKKPKLVRKPSAKPQQLSHILQASHLLLSVASRVHGISRPLHEVRSWSGRLLARSINRDTGRGDTRYLIRYNPWGVDVLHEIVTIKLRRQFIRSCPRSSP